MLKKLKDIVIWPARKYKTTGKDRYLFIPAAIGAPIYIGWLCTTKNNGIPWFPFIVACLCCVTYGAIVGSIINKEKSNAKL